MAEVAGRERRGLLVPVWKEPSTQRVTSIFFVIIFFLKIFFLLLCTTCALSGGFLPAVLQFCITAVPKGTTQRTVSGTRFPSNLHDADCTPGSRLPGVAGSISVYKRALLLSIAWQSHQHDDGLRRSFTRFLKVNLCSHTLVLLELNTLQTTYRPNT